MALGLTMYLPEKDRLSATKEYLLGNIAMSMGGRIVGLGLADEILTLWLSTPFEGGRHARRVAQIAEIEKSTLTPER